MATQKVFEYLKKHGQLLDLDIAAAIKLPLEDVRQALKELSAQQEISTCSVTIFNKKKQVDAIQCRVFGFVPKPAPGRKPAK